MSSDVNNLLNAETPIKGDGIERDKWGRYKLVDPETGELKAWTRATTLAGCLEDHSALEVWKNRNLVFGIGRREDLFALASSVSSVQLPEDKETLDAVINAAEEVAGGNSQANLGTALHGFTQNKDLGRDTPVPSQWQGDVSAYLDAYKALGLWPQQEFVEKVLIIPEIDTAGTVDRLLMGDTWELPRIGDLKTGKIKGKGRSFAVQLAIYAHATHWFDPATKTYHEMPELDKTKGVIIHLPVGKAQCDLYELDLVAGWEGALLAYELHKWRKRNDLSVLISAPTNEVETPVVEPETPVIPDDVEDFAPPDQPKPKTKRKPAAKKKTPEKDPQQAREEAIAKAVAGEPLERKTSEEEPPAPTHNSCLVCTQKIPVEEYSEHTDKHLFEARFNWMKERIKFIISEGQGAELGDMWANTCAGIATFKAGGPKTHEEIDRIGGACALVEMTHQLPFFDNDPAKQKETINKWIGSEQNDQRQLISQ